MVEKDRQKVARTLDCKGMLCPMPIYMTSQAMASLEPGDVIEVICTDPGSKADFPAFARQAGHELLSSEERDGTQVFRIRKAGDK